MRFGIHVGHLGGPLAELRRLWRFADDNGFDWFSVSDHFQETPGQGGNGPCLDAVATMAVAAAETRRVGIGCLVFCVSYRHPAIIAKAMTTIDALSGGRVTCGLGAGWHEPEYRSYGIPFPAPGVREDQLEEYIQVVRLLLDEPYAEFTGSHYRLERAPNFPKPVQGRLPVWIGGGGEKRTLQTAARHADGWNVPYLGPQEWAAKNAALDRWCERLERDPRAIVRTANVGFYVGATARGRAVAERRFAKEWGVDQGGRTGFLRGAPQDAARMVAEYRDRGVAQLNLAVRAGPYDWDALAAFAGEVVPQFRG